MSLTARKTGSPNRWQILYGDEPVADFHAPAAVADADGALAVYRAIMAELPAAYAITGRDGIVAFAAAAVERLAEGDRLLPLEVAQAPAFDPAAERLDGLAHEIGADSVRRVALVRAKTVGERAADDAAAAAEAARQPGAILARLAVLEAAVAALQESAAEVKG